MSVTYGFYNSQNGDRKYDAKQMSGIFDGIIEDGVYARVGNQMMVYPGSGWTVNVGTGRAWFNHTWTFNDAVLPLTLSPADVTRNRIDAVVLEVDAREAVRANSIKIITGTPSATPSNPVLQRSTYVNQYPLAYIFVAGGATSIRQADITNCIGTSECPFVTSPLESLNLDSLISQQRDAWTFLMENTQQNAYSDFAAWFTSAKQNWTQQMQSWSTSAKQNWTQQMQDWFDGFVEDGDSELAELLRIALASHRSLRVYNDGIIPATSGTKLTFREGQNPYSTSYFYPATNLQQGDYVIGTNGYIGEITRIDEEIGGAIPRNMDITATGISIVPAATALTAADISTQLSIGSTNCNNVQEALMALLSAIGSGSGSGGAVSSVNRKTGAVMLDATDIGVNFTLTSQASNIQDALDQIVFMTPASAQSAGTGGLVPAPPQNAQNKVLHGDGGWYLPDAANITAQTHAGAGTVADKLNALEQQTNCCYIDKTSQYAAAGYPSGNGTLTDIKAFALTLGAGSYYINAGNSEGKFFLRVASVGGSAYEIEFYQYHSAGYRYYAAHYGSTIWTEINHVNIEFGADDETVIKLAGEEIATKASVDTLVTQINTVLAAVVGGGNNAQS